MRVLLPGLPAVLGLAAALVVLLWLVPPVTRWTPESAAPRGSWERRSRRGLRPGARPETDAGASSRALVPEALELLGLALLGGGSLAEAARITAAVLPGDRGQPTATVAAALRRGHDTEQAWAEAGPLWEPARRSLDLAAVAGIAPGPALRQTAGDLRAAAITEVEVATARLGVRMVLPLGLAFLPAFVLTTVLPLVIALTQDLAW